MTMKERVKKSVLLICIGIVVNVALALIKLYVGLSSNSLCIMLDATNSFFDILTCIVTLIVFVVLLSPKSEKAPFGYGRGEYLAGFIVAVVTVVVGGVFFINSLNRLAMPEPVWFSWQNCVLICVAIPVKAAIAVLYGVANKKLRSKAIKAIMLDSIIDVAVTFTSLISFAVSSRVDYAVDAIVGIVISIVVIVFAIKMVIDNVKAVVLGDDAQEERTAIESVCTRRGVKLDKLVLHDYGYGAKVGIAYVSDASDSNAMKREVLDSVGAEVEFIVVASSEADENAPLAEQLDSTAQNVEILQDDKQAQNAEITQKDEQAQSTKASQSEQL